MAIFNSYVKLPEGRTYELFLYQNVSEVDFLLMLALSVPPSAIGHGTGKSWNILNFGFENHLHIWHSRNFGRGVFQQTRLVHTEYWMTIPQTVLVKPLNPFFCGWRNPFSWSVFFLVISHRTTCRRLISCLPAVLWRPLGNGTVKGWLVDNWIHHESLHGMENGSHTSIVDN